MDAPNKNHIWFDSKIMTNRSSGMLDVDIINPGTKVAVENITWPNKFNMFKEVYKFYVHN